jgi:DNA polymerase
MKNIHSEIRRVKMSDSVDKEMHALRERAVVCVDCGLSTTRTKVVFGEGNPRAKLVLVGEGPGEKDDSMGRPFVGPSGFLLDEVLIENKVYRSDVWLTNIIKCRAASMEGSRLKNRPPHVDEIRACHKWLEGELGLIKPTAILCLGSPAASVLIHKSFKMKDEMGKWFTDTPHAPFVMATYNPAYILRQEGEAYEEARRALSWAIAQSKEKCEKEGDMPKMTLF